MEIVYKDESYAIMGACFEVYRECGAGFVEPIYQECVGIELGQRGIPFADKVQLPLHYKDRPLVSTHIPDFFCYDKIIVELKAVSALADEHRAQVHNYLKDHRLQAWIACQLRPLPQARIRTDRSLTPAFG